MMKAEQKRSILRDKLKTIAHMIDDAEGQKRTAQEVLDRLAQLKAEIEVELSMLGWWK